MSNTKETLRKRRHVRIRAKVSGTTARPRLVVFKSITHTYAQIIDDTKNVTIVSVSDMGSKEKGTKTDKAKTIGLAIAASAKEKKITSVVFDRNGYKYHGRVKALADGAREGGLTF